MPDSVRSVLSVSGGLDSSIVAVAAAASGLQPHYVTLATAAALGDEREFARILAKRTGAHLHEQRERLDLIDLATSYAAHLPRPTARAFSQSIDRTIFNVAREIEACAYFHGGGGDNVFCMLNSVLPAVDRLRVQGMSGGTFATIADVAALAQHSWIETGWRTLQRSLSRDRGYRPRPQPLFLHPDVLAASTAPEHPWLDAPRGALPGKAMHLAWILGIQNFLEGHAHEREIAWHAPLLTQPVVETCLAIPTWAWCEGGRNRSVARDAFADLLPAEILHRHSKGSPTSLLYELVEQRAEQVGAMLFEGILAKSGLLDVRAMTAVFRNRARVRSADLIRLMQFVDVEAWLQSGPGSGRASG
jgi:asparagine synthase (glutamine-hydrolysing)